jgi:branched-chain amino acid transport system ATP-binding protein
MGAILKVQGLRAGYGRAEAIRGVDLVVEEGSICSVIGPNGAGKSTLLAALMGTVAAQGAIYFDGRPVQSMTTEERALAGMALVPEKRELFTTMSVEDNLVLGGWRPRAMGTPNWRASINEVYAMFPRLRERRTQLAGTLSGGERQMLAIGRGLISRPRLLMLDEPSLGLAPRTVAEILKTVGWLKSQGTTILLIEQNARAALAISDHGYVIETGEFVLQGPAAELARDPSIVNAYLGTALA